MMVEVMINQQTSCCVFGFFISTHGANSPGGLAGAPAPMADKLLLSMQEAMSLPKQSQHMKAASVCTI